MLFLHKVKIRIMQVTENTRLNFNGVEAIKWIVGLVVVVWGVHSYVSTTSSILQNHESRIKSVELEQAETKQVLKDMRSETQQGFKDMMLELKEDRTMILRHEYSNLNKPYYQAK
jgi:hypothetical protein